MTQEIVYTTETQRGNSTESAFSRLLELFPESFEKQTPDETAMSLAGNTFRDEAVRDKDIPYFLESYGLGTIQFEILSNGNVRLPVTLHFDETNRIPEGYAYKGGAARALLLRTLGKNRKYIPRDIDLIRLSSEPYSGADRDLSERFMKDDYEFGDGVEPVGSTEDYLTTRDFTINELYATDSEIIATPQCIKDTIRGIVRITDYERNLFYGHGDKMLSKMLRLYSEGIVEDIPFMLMDIKVGELGESFITPFWLAVQLDRAFQKGRTHAEEFVRTLILHNQIPDSITKASQARDYLLNLLQSNDFYFRYAPTSQFFLEEQFIDDSYTSLPKFRGHHKSRGDK